MEKKADPKPQGNYVPAVRHGDIIYTAGMTPRRNGILLKEGKILASFPAEEYRDALRTAAENALTAAENRLKQNERIVQILSVTVFLNAEEGFTAHPKIADFASAYFKERLGDAGIGCRAAVGVASLPGNAPCEIQIIAAAGT